MSMKKLSFLLLFCLLLGKSLSIFGSSFENPPVPSSRLLESEEKTPDEENDRSFGASDAESESEPEEILSPEETEFFRAIENDNLEEVTALLDQNPDLIHARKRDLSAFMLAAEVGSHPFMLEELLDRGCPDGLETAESREATLRHLTSQESTLPLSFSMLRSPSLFFPDDPNGASWSYEHRRAHDLIIEIREAKERESLLSRDWELEESFHKAAKQKSNWIMLYLLNFSLSEGHFDTPSRKIKEDLFEKINRFNELAYIRRFLSQERIQDALNYEHKPKEDLMFCIEHSYYRTFSALLSIFSIEGLPPQEQQELLVLSTTKKNGAFTRALLEQGVNPNPLEATQPSALEASLRLESSPSVQALLEAKATVDRPLFPLTTWGGEPLMKRLLELNADLNEREPESGETAVMKAAQSGHFEAVFFLVEQGADITLKSNEAETALTLSEENLKEKRSRKKEKEKRWYARKGVLYESSDSSSYSSSDSSTTTDSDSSDYSGDGTSRSELRLYKKPKKSKRIKVIEFLRFVHRRNSGKGGGASKD